MHIYPYIRMRRNFLLTLLFTTCFLFPTLSWGNWNSVQVPADFVRVTDYETLNETDTYVLGAMSQNEGLVIMASTLTGSTNNKLKGLLPTAWNESSVTISNAACLWRIKKGSNGQLSLMSYDGSLFLTRKAAGSLGLQLTANSSEESAWKVSQIDNDAFTLTDVADESRCLSLYSTPKGDKMVYYFDNYSSYDTNELYIFKLPVKFSETTGKVVMPANGERVALSYNTYVRLTDGSAQNGQDAWLTNGSVAPLPNLDAWTCERVGTETFMLKNANGYMGYDLQPSASHLLWQVVNGHIGTTEQPVRYLCFDKDERTWQVVDEDKALLGASFVSVAAEAQRTLSEQGVCKLSGGWTASALSALDWNGVKCLDLCDLALPINSTAFTHTPESHNTPIFVASTMHDYVPASWLFVVECGTKNQLRGIATLIDGEEFYTDRSFAVSSGQLTYRRQVAQADCWQTICLPFKATAKNCELATFEQLSDDSLHFAATSTLNQGTPYLIKSAHSGTVELTSEACSLMPSLDDSGIFRGTYTPLTVTSESEHIYMLSPTEQAFVHAAATSRLAPFRAYLKLGQASKARLKIR